MTDEKIIITKSNWQNFQDQALFWKYQDDMIPIRLGKLSNRVIWVQLLNDTRRPKILLEVPLTCYRYFFYPQWGLFCLTYPFHQSLFHSITNQFSSWSLDLTYIIFEYLEPIVLECEKGDFIDAQDPAFEWCEAVVVQQRDSFMVLVHYRGWSKVWDEWILLSSPRLATWQSKSCDSTSKELYQRSFELYRHHFCLKNS